jgi:hypothetical protein
MSISRTAHAPHIPDWPVSLALPENAESRARPFVDPRFGVGTQLAGLSDLAPADKNKVLDLLSGGATISNIRLPASTLGIEHGHAAILIESPKGRMLIAVFPKGFPPRAQVQVDTDIDATLKRGKFQNSVSVSTADGARLVHAFNEVLSLYMKKDLTPYYPANTCFTFADALMVASRNAKSD